MKIMGRVRGGEEKHREGNKGSKIPGAGRDQPGGLRYAGGQREISGILTVPLVLGMNTGRARVGARRTPTGAKGRRETLVVTMGKEESATRKVMTGGPLKRARGRQRLSSAFGFETHLCFERFQSGAEDP